MAKQYQNIDKLSSIYLIQFSSSKYNDYNLKYFSMVETGHDDTNTVKEQELVSENIDKVEDLTSSQEKSTSKIADLYQKIEDSVKSIEEPRRNSAGNNSLPPPPNGAPPNLPESVRIESSSATDDKPTTKKKKKYGMKKKKSDISKLP